MNKQCFISINDLKPNQIKGIFELAKKLKTELKTDGKNTPFFLGKTLVMIFEKPSLRTRLSFEIGMTQLGGHAVYLAPSDIGLGARESVADVAKVAGSMGNMIIARVSKHETVRKLAQYAKVPVINGLSDLQHPCQILSDLFTITEFKGKLKGLKLSYIGDGENNVAHSLALAAGMLGIIYVIASPKEYRMKKNIVDRAKELAEKSGGSIYETTDPDIAAREADIIYTDTWISMGDESEKNKRLKIFPPYKVTEELMKLAKRDAIFMHDLPAYRGNEVQAEVIDGPQSAVFQQAENRLHVQKALMLYLLGTI